MTRWALLIAIAMAGVAHAAPPGRRIVAILDVRVEGMADTVGKQFERELEEQLDTNAFWLSTRAQVRERMKLSTKWIEGCHVGPCLGELRTQTSAQLALLAALKAEGTSYGYVVTLVRTDTGRVLSQESGRCDVCTAKEAMREATLATIKLLNEVPDKLPDEVGERGAQIDLAVGKLVRHMKADDRRWKRRGIGLLVAGLGIAAAGVTAYLVTDEDPTLAAVGAGGGLALGGIIVMTF